MKNRFKKLAIICIAFIGISLIAQAADNWFLPRVEFVSATNNYEGAVYLVFNYACVTNLKLIDCATNKTMWESPVEFSYEDRLCTVTLLDLPPGLYTFKVLAEDELMERTAESAPFSVYVNAVEP